MLTFYIVRHGLTLFNLSGRLQGWCDSPLLDEGIQDAKKLHNSLYDIPFVKAYCSTSERTRDTLDYILGNRNIEVTCDKRLKEYYFGSVEGELHTLLPKEKIDDLLFTGWTEYGGESLEMLEKRVFEVLEDIANKHKDGNVLVVTHGAVISCIINKFKHETVKEMYKNKYKIRNCSITKLSYDGTFHLLSYDDISYLNPIE